MKPNYYIFLDIDGVLYDWQYIKTIKDQGLAKMGGTITQFNPQSIDALKFLIQQLEQNYKVKLVITSTWRHHFLEIARLLLKYGIPRHIRIESTPITSYPDKRGEEILQYLNGRPDTQNIVIIDDELFDYQQHFSKHKIIKTNMFDNSLCKEHITKFLNENIIQAEK